MNVLFAPYEFAGIKMRDLKMMEDVITSRKGDMISMCRPFIREPELINR